MNVLTSLPVVPCPVEETNEKKYMGIRSLLIMHKDGCLKSVKKNGLDIKNR